MRRFVAALKLSQLGSRLGEKSTNERNHVQNEQTNAVGGNYEPFVRFATQRNVTARPNAPTPFPDKMGFS